MPIYVEPCGKQADHGIDRQNSDHKEDHAGGDCSDDRHALP